MELGREELYSTYLENFVISIRFGYTSSNSNYQKKLLKRRTLRSKTIFGKWKPFKNDDKCFLFHLKSSFRS